MDTYLYICMYKYKLDMLLPSLPACYNRIHVSISKKFMYKEKLDIDLNAIITEYKN